MVAIAGHHRQRVHSPRRTEDRFTLAGFLALQMTRTTEYPGASDVPRAGRALGGDRVLTQDLMAESVRPM
jgi:hypothetical protein